MNNAPPVQLIGSNIALLLTPFYCKYAIFASTLKDTKKFAKKAAKHFLKCNLKNVDRIHSSALYYESEPRYKNDLQFCFDKQYLTSSENKTTITSFGRAALENYLKAPSHAIIIIAIAIASLIVNIIVPIATHCYI